MENQKQLKQILFIALLAMTALILLLAAVNAFLVWQLFLIPAPTTPDVPGVQGPTPTEVSQPEQPLAPDETATLQPTEEASVPVDEDRTPQPVSEEFVYQVVAGDNLISIASEQGVGMQDIQRRNQMYGDLVIMRQELVIPRGPQPAFDLVLAPETTDNFYTQSYQPDIIDESFFVLWFNENDFAYLAREPLYFEIENARLHAENQFGREFEEQFNLYAAGSPFAANPALRSYVTADGEVFVLFDGAGDVNDVNFHISYALAKAWLVQMWGESPKPFVAEGMALAAADRRVSRFERLSLCDITKAYSEVGLLSDIDRGEMELDVLLFDYANNALAGCFAAYLLDTYEPEELRVLYQTGDFAVDSGSSWQAEETSFQRWLDKSAPERLIEYEAFTTAFDQLTVLNKAFFPGFLAYGDQTLSIYYSLDQARLALLRNDLPAAEFYLANAEVLLTLDNNAGEKPTPAATRTRIVLPTAFPTIKPTEP
jgi:LysM repeat protein